MSVREQAERNVARYRGVTFAFVQERERRECQAFTSPEDVPHTWFAAVQAELYAILRGERQS